MAAVSTSRMHSVTRGACARTGPVRRRLAPMQATFKITLKTPTGDKVIDCDDDEYILAAAEAAGVDLPYSCQAGSCSTCVGKLVSGDIDQSEQQTLDEEQLAQNFMLTCVAYPVSDVVILTDQQENMY